MFSPAIQPRKDIDPSEWDVIRSEFINSKRLNFKDISKQFNVDYNDVVTIARKEKWADARKDRITRGTEATVNKGMDKVTEVNDRHTITYRNMQALGLAQLNIALNSLRDAQDKATKEGRTLSHDDKAMMGQQRLKFLYDALKIAMDGERITLGIPTAIAINKTELSGKDGTPMFERVDKDELSDTIARAIEAIGSPAA
jgi:hypothetical protein